MPKHTIEVEINEEGRIVSEAKGVKGKSCSELTKWLDALGRVEVDKKTSDYFKDDNQTVRIGR